MPSTATTSNRNAGVSCRRVHLVGSLPPEIATNEYDAMRWQLKHVTPAELRTLPADRDPKWIVDYLLNLQAVPALQPILHGRFIRYDDPIAYRVVPGQQLTPEDLALRRSAAVEAALKARDRLEMEYGRPLPPHQVSIPAPLDLSLFTFGVPAAGMGLLPARAAVAAVRAAVTHLPLFTTAVADEIRGLHEQWGTDIVFQLESPAICVGYDRSPRALWPVTTRYLLRATARLLLALPPDAALVLHLWCHGDLNNEPIADPHSLVPMVRFANLLAERLRSAGRAVPPMHAAIANGARPAPLDPVFYRPLRELDDNTPFIAGLVDEGHPARTAAALELVEQALNRPVHALAAPCGLGRRTPARAEANLRLARTMTGCPVIGIPGMAKPGR